MSSDSILHLSAPNPRPGIIDDAWWGEHAPRTAVGISINRHEAPVILLSPDGSTSHVECDGYSTCPLGERREWHDHTDGSLRCSRCPVDES